MKKQQVKELIKKMNAENEIREKAVNEQGFTIYSLGKWHGSYAIMYKGKELGGLCFEYFSSALDYIEQGCKWHKDEIMA